MGKHFLGPTRHHRKLAKLRRASHKAKCVIPKTKQSQNEHVGQVATEVTQLFRGGSKKTSPGNIVGSDSVLGDAGSLNRPTIKASHAQRALARIFGDVFAAVGAARRAVGKYRAQPAMAFMTAAIASARRLCSMVPKYVHGEVSDLNGCLDDARVALSRLSAGIARAEAAVVLEMLIALDEVYHRLRYLASVIGNLDHAVPQPHYYFADGGKAWDVGGAADAKAVKDFLETYVGPGQEKVLSSFLDLRVCSEDLVENPLLQLLQARWRESIIRLANSGLVPSQLRMCQPTPEQMSQPLTMRGRDPLAGKDVRSWRDAARVWSCHFYSYAVPNGEALTALCKYSPLVEIGAGTGYWSHLLRRRGATVFCYDKDPAPLFSQTLDWQSQGKSNEYHGLCRAWTQVECGDERSAAFHPGASLFLCYPPPDSPMALRALQAYEGQVVCLVGEWSGDTGTASFQTALCDHFTLHERILLPNWGDSAAELTIWHRSRKRVKSRSPLSCLSCGKSGGNIRRCRLTYDAIFCSEACSTVPTALERHRAALAMRMALFVPGGACRSKVLEAMPKYNNPNHFQTVH